ncbi:hypothetical protein J2Y00_004782 [Deinococcus soli (ex Cha et al. 2016)]|uniref:Uncharacterized protein n=2 Tax=Deinococcus soli (ex Cha et al. 2016) TaxID=1309411 RepID=A0ACC6KNR8_9DEIO|nr:hypothetical protein [Deinococcus soli (ex Cha et al. 2016)]MDR6331083.1 hypothetical protein [Deinococcus soli (ex Cha et al. 2016)]MDR6754279.1 hypothetical protein [Deinococcus soli (ex Cha et al. 2016)]
MTHEPQPQHPVSNAPTALPYRAPRVTPLGPWTSITLVQSVPIGPGSFGTMFNSDAAQR